MSKILSMSIDNADIAMLSFAMNSAISERKNNASPDAVKAYKDLWRRIQEGIKEGDKMREIKFRGKANDGRWIYGGLVCSDNIEPAIYFEVGNKVCRMEWAYVDPATVGQFTGLHDKNGREIYEGDILLWTRKNVHIEGRQLQDFSHKCIVYYDNNKCAFQFRCELRCGACVGYLDFDDDRADESYIEVIGNVFDNFDLLK